ncbi:sigma-70 family RNA polymerase sigma factor [Nocardia sp. NPDC019255]|uniref:RNA polymerase sigma factor n=1 Tax=Nocardia sp. NPDC019255 TaxID=3154591 RepID=UPI0033EE4123
MTGPELLDEPEWQRPDSTEPSALRRFFESRLIQGEEDRFAWFDVYLVRHDRLTQRLAWIYQDRFPFLEAEDIAQETRLRLLTDEKFDPLRPDAPGYIVRATRYAVMTLLRTRQSKQGKDTELQPWHENSVALKQPESGFEFDVLDPLRRIGALADLSEVQTQVLLRVHGLDMTYAEIATDLGLNETNVRQIRSRAQKAINKAIGLTAREDQAVKLFRRHHPRSHSSVLELIAAEMDTSPAQCRRILGEARAKIAAFFGS